MYKCVCSACVRVACDRLACAAIGIFGIFDIHTDKHTNKHTTDNAIKSRWIVSGARFPSRRCRRCVVDAVIMRTLCYLALCCLCVCLSLSVFSFIWLLVVSLFVLNAHTRESHSVLLLLWWCWGDTRWWCPGTQIKSVQPGRNNKNDDDDDFDDNDVAETATTTATTTQERCHSKPIREFMVGVFCNSAGFVR